MEDCIRIRIQDIVDPYFRWLRLGQINMLTFIYYPDWQETKVGDVMILSNQESTLTVKIIGLYHQGSYDQLLHRFGSKLVPVGDYDCIKEELRHCSCILDEKRYGVIGVEVMIM